MKKLRLVLVTGYLMLCCVGCIYSFFLILIISVDTVTPIVKDIPISISANGTIRLKEYGVFSANTADVKGIYVKEGDRVNEGETLALIKENSKSIPVLSNIENYQNSIYNQYASAVSKLVGNSDIAELYGNINMRMLDEYTSVIEEGDRLTSPINGVISRVNIEENSNTGIAVPSFVVSNYSDVYVICKIDEDRIGKICIGQEVTVSGVGLTKKYSGVVSNISQTANAVILSGDKSSVDVTITIIDPDETITSGFSAECTIYIGCDKNIITVPQECILQDENGNEYLFLFENGVAKVRYVECNYYKNGIVGVRGIDSFDCVIIDTEGVKDGSKVILND